MAEQPAAVDPDLRKKAVARSWLCPGAGFALVGQHRVAWLSYAAPFAGLAACVWLAVEPEGLALGILAAAFLAGLVLWVGEQVACRKAALRTPRPRFLTGGFLPVATVLVWLAGVGMVVLVITFYGTLAVGGSGMSPTLEWGERLVYHRRVEPDQLRRGGIILYHVPPKSSWGEPGSLVVSRILAVQGDRLSIHNARYVLNGVPGPLAASAGGLPIVLPVPLAPHTVTVPRGCFFVVQDSPIGAFDSRVLSWVRREDVVSTNLYYLSGQGFLRPVP
jgi:signal peptidase I